jgi:uncharacterized membrane protein YagU involved in acid resistance
MSNLLVRAAAGAAAGFTATAPMTAVMAAAREALPEPEQYSLPPRIVTERAAQTAGVAHRMDEPEKKAATTVAHFGFGTGAGAVYGAVAPLLPFHPVVNGVAFGLGVWASSYLGWLPAAGLHPPAARESAERNAMNVGAHVVWGAVLGLLTDQLVGRDRSERNGRLAYENPAVMASG